jgi:hypothetical protein
MQNVPIMTFCRETLESSASEYLLRLLVLLTFYIEHPQYGIGWILVGCIFFCFVSFFHCCCGLCEEHFLNLEPITYVSQDRLSLHSKLAKPLTVTTNYALLTAY